VRQLIVAFLLLVSTISLSANFHVGGGVPLTYNTASAQTSTKELRLGLALAARYDLDLGGEFFEFIAAFSKSPLLSQSVNSETRLELCNETFFSSLFSFPGACVQYQFRLGALYRWKYGFSGGMSFTYNHTTNLTYYGTTIYNTNWSYWGIGPMLSWSVDVGGVLLVPTLNLDFGFASITLSTEKISALQVGGTFYALVRIF